MNKLQTLNQMKFKKLSYAAVSSHLRRGSNLFGTYRTLLALMVVALHLGDVRAIGVYAVFGFYCLSGYLMTYIMCTNYGFTSSGILKYAVNRGLRIYPIYWVSILFTVILIWLFGSDVTTSVNRGLYLLGELEGILRNIFLFFPFREFPRLTPPAWALTVEIFFYILIGLGLSKNKLITMGWFILSVAYHIYAYASLLGFAERYYTIFAASLPFATGALIFHYRSVLLTYVNKLKGVRYSYFPYFLLSLILVNWALGVKLRQSADLFFYINYLLCALMVNVLSERKKLPFISRKFDKLMGDFSYPIYLIHYQVGVIVIVCFGALRISFERGEMMFMLVSIPVIFAFSWLFIIGIERPIELIRSKIKA
jgi:peptidoglycan/LPS O-acetylase OafA/YrhL